MKALYVHIPFCDHICSYCDFCKVFYKEDWAWQYLDALAYEIKDKKIEGEFETIYIGGGTPSALSLKQLKKLFEILAPFSKNCIEYSIEVNPESMNEDKLKLMRDFHINRLSIGVQTFHDSLLKSIQRYHDSKKAIDLIHQAHQIGIDDINVDLIYGLPNQQLTDVYEDIQMISKLDVSHVSIYSLILEDHTVLKNNGFVPLDDEEDAYWYQRIHDELSKNGFQQYEVSNFYRVKPSLHNLTYWLYQDYEGIGLSAHSLIRHHRKENTRSLTQYLKHHYLQEDIELSLKDEMFEKIMMGLRLTEGIDMNEFNDIYHIDFYQTYQNVIEKYQKLHMLEITHHHLRTTFLGMNFLNSILVDFIEWE